MDKKQSSEEKKKLRSCLKTQKKRVAALKKAVSKSDKELKKIETSRTAKLREIGKIVYVNYKTNRNTDIPEAIIAILKRYNQRQTDVKKQIEERKAGLNVQSYRLTAMKKTKKVPDDFDVNLE